MKFRVFKQKEQDRFIKTLACLSEENKVKGYKESANILEIANKSRMNIQDAYKLAEKLEIMGYVAHEPYDNREKWPQIFYYPTDKGKMYFDVKINEERADTHRTLLTPIAVALVTGGIGYILTQVLPHIIELVEEIFP